jgi:hypothetical protein
MLVTTIITIPTLKSPMLPMCYHGYCIPTICATLIPISQATASVAIHCRILKNKNIGWPPMFIICSVCSCRHPDRYNQPRMCSFLAGCAKHAQQVTQNNLVPSTGHTTPSLRSLLLSCFTFLCLLHPQFSRLFLLLNIYIPQ